MDKLRIFLIPFFLIIVLGLSASTANAANIDETVNAIQETFAKITNISGSFSQASYIKDFDETYDFSGTFYLIKPSLMMWEYNKPRDEKVTINGTDTWIYKKSQNQVMKMTFSKEDYSRVPIAILQSFENIKDDYTITMPEENALQLVPKKRIGFIHTLVIETSQTKFPIKSFTILDTYGNVILIEIKNIKVNPGLSEKIFDFKVPEGAKVFDMSK